MPNCSDCQWLKYKVDIAAALSVKASEHVLRIADDAPEISLAIVVMRRTRSALEECELEYEAHIAVHTHRVGELRFPLLRMSDLD
jgi:hypothetical protein